MKVKCENCGKHFIISPSLFYRSKHHFCSHKCFGKFLVGKKIHSIHYKEELSRKWKGKGNPNFKEKVLNKCKFCGTEFYTVPSLRRIYCSRRCASADIIPWNKGLKYTEKMKNKISLATRKAMQDSGIREKCLKGALFHLENSWKGFTSIERSVYIGLENIRLEPKKQYRLYENKVLIGVVDFAFPEDKVIIECQGDYWHANPKFYKVLNETQVRVLKKDRIKREWAFKHGWKILAFYEDEIKNRLDNVLCKVDNVLREGNVTLVTKES